VGAVRGDPARRYMHYMDDLDCLTQNQIFWTPYDRDELENLGLSDMCTRDEELWRSVVPLIYFFAVELHLPHRVKRQFGRLQDFPPEAISTSQALHRIDRKKRYTENDWRVKHAVPLGQWEQRHRMNPDSGPAHRHNHYKDYLRWLHSVSRVSIKPPRSTEPIEDREDTDDDDDIVDEYNDITRSGVQPERAPLQNYMAQQLGRLANEAGVAMVHASQGGNGGGHLRAFAERVRRSCKRMAAKLNCIARPDEAFALAHKLQELQVLMPLLRASGPRFTTVKRPPEPLLVRPLERVPVLLRGGKVFNHPKNPRSPTHNVTQERRTQTLRSLGCHICSMLLQARRHRGNLARPCRLRLLHVSNVVAVTGPTLVAPMLCPRSLDAHDAAMNRSALQRNAVAAARRPPSTYSYL